MPAERSANSSPSKHPTPQAIVLESIMRTNLPAQLSELTNMKLELTESDIEQLARSRQAALFEHGMLEFGKPAILQIAEAFARSPFLFEEDCAETLESVQECFYRMRSETPGVVPDEELIEGMLLAFDGICGGDCETLATLSPSDVLDQLDPHEDREAPHDEACCITDDDGRTYTWNPDEWKDDLLAPGWLGERWDDDWN